MNKLTLLAVTLTLLAGCAARALNENSPWYVMPAGSALILHGDLPVAEGTARAYVQFGRAATPGEIDEFYPYCYFLQRAVARAGGSPLTIARDEFVTGQVTRRFAGIGAMHRFAALGFNTGDRGGNSNRTFNTEVRLHSEAQPQVYKLICAFWGDPALERHLSVAQIRAALGDIATLRLPQ